MLLGRLIVFLIPLTLIGCTDDAEQGRRDWMDKQRAKMVRALKDPDSAKFRDEILHRDALCGEVNAKNSVGGYTGYRRFVAGSLFFVIQGEPVQFDEVVGEAEVNRQTEIINSLQLAKKAVYVSALDSGDDLPSTEELHLAEFAALWGEFCGG